jgi:hypothetical protein
MTMLSTALGASLILIFTLTYVHVESLSYCSHQFLEQSFRHATQSLNIQKDRHFKRGICRNQAKLEFKKSANILNSTVTSGELEGQEIEIKARTVWGKKNEDQ